MYQVRRGTSEDIPAILSLLEDHADAYGSKHSMFPDWNHAHGFVTMLINNHLVLLCTHDGVPIGLKAGMVIPHMYNPKIMTLVENFWWVDPAWRGTRAGAMLLDAFINYGRQHMDWVLCIADQDSNVRDEAFFKRGFRLKEKTFLLEV